MDNTKTKVSIYYQSVSKSGKCPICEEKYHHSIGSASFGSHPEQKERCELKVYQVVCNGCGFVMSFSSKIVNGTE
jgi:hypothetical protein